MRSSGLVVIGMALLEMGQWALGFQTLKPGPVAPSLPAACQYR